MDCEKFDQHVIDALYGELDELTHLATKRHMESCARCASAFEALRATRDVGVLPLEEPPEQLEARILEAAAAAQRTIPWRRKALWALAWAGSHAMRPQLAMAALFVLVIGSSLLLLRAKPGTVGIAPVRVTERGTPVPEEAVVPPPPAALPREQAEREAPEKENAAKTAAHASADPPADAQSALVQAQTVRESSGCAGAVGLYDSVGARFPGTAQASQAMWEAAECHKSLGNTAKAQDLYLSLRSTESYRERAEQQLALSEANQRNQMVPGAATASASPQAVAVQAAAEAADSDEARADKKASAPATTGKAVAAPLKPAPKAKAGASPVPAAPLRDAAGF